ncbi:MAG: archaeosortase/exosortase family protein, partial [Acetobacteraceae bacterium]|nr:archaeosortase/exosortase family protein [Acetobacteraceae bacterium]
FIAASLVVPVIANGFRALGIVVLGQILGSAEAAAADHIIYGWLFFSVVMLLLIAGGHAFRDGLATEGPIKAPPAPRLAAPPGWCLALTLMLAGLGPALATAIDTRLTSPKLVEVNPIVMPAGCVATPSPNSEAPARKVFSLVCADHTFTETVQAFPARSTSSAMIVERRSITQEIGAENATILPVDLPDGAGHWTVVQTSEPDRLTAYASWVNGVQFASGLQQRLAQAQDSLLGADYAPVLITITTAEPERSSAPHRQATMAALLSVLHAQTGLTARVARMSAVWD